MPPVWSPLTEAIQENLRRFISRRGLNTSNPSTPQDYLYVQWKNPGDILSVLLLLGPDIVQKAIAQLAGRSVVPVSFSFGWVAYAVSAIMSAFGDGTLMPDTDMANTLVIGADSGHIRTTKSWVLGRILRDLDGAVDNEMEDREDEHVTNPEDEKNRHRISQQPKKPWEALRVSVYEVDPEPPADHGVPVCDWVWYTGFIAIALQLCISIIPWCFHSDRDWSCFLITASGNFLAAVGGSLPQWREEKWACPKKGGATVTLTQGNGARHAVVIKGRKGVGLDLEILAQATRVSHASWLTRIACAILALFWTVFLITVSGIKKNSWYILGVGFLGSIQNLFVAGTKRPPSAQGVHLKLVEVITASRVKDTLRQLEQKHQYVGTSLLNVFFPGGLRCKGEELQFWQAAIEKRREPNKFGSRVDLIPHVPLDPRNDGSQNISA